MATQHQRPMWRRRIIDKMSKGSRTPGSTKGETCQTDTKKKFFFSSPKAYLHPQYHIWHEKAKRYNEGGQQK